MKFYNHPDFESLNKKWQVYADCFEGDHDTMVNWNYLVPHMLEQSGVEGSSKLFSSRQKRTQYTNNALDIFQRYVGLMFAKAYEYDNETDQLLTSINGWKDIDGEGSTFDEFIKQSIFKARFLYGRVYLLTDAPNVQSQTLADKKKLGKRPYWQILNTQAVPAWKYFTSGEQKGKLEWLRFNYQYLPDWTNPFQAAEYESRAKLFRLVDGVYTVEDYQVKNDEAKLVDSVQIAGFNYLPISVIKNGDSYLKQVVPHIMKHLNYDSNVANILHYQGYQDKSVMGDLSDEDKTASGEYVVKFYPSGTTVQTEEPCYPQGLIEERDKAEAAIFKAAFHLSRNAASDSKSVESAETLSKVKEDLIAYIKTELTTIEDLVNDGLKNLAAFEGDNNFQGKITFNKDISIESIDEALNVELAYKDDIKKYPTWHKSVLKKRVQGMNLSNADDIINEIDTTYKADVPPLENAITDVITGV